MTVRPADITTVRILCVGSSVDDMRRYLCNADAAGAEDAQLQAVPHYGLNGSLVGQLYFSTQLRVLINFAPN